jgi:hypothetical protein
LVIVIQNGYELNELHGVQISSEANNDLLVYETSSTLWKNKSISTIFGGTPLVSVPTLDQVTTAGNTTTNAITVGKLSIVNTSTTVSPLIISGTNPSVSGIGTDYFVINGTGNVGVTLKTDTGGYVAHRFFANGSELGVFYAGETNKEFVFKNSTTGYIDFQTTSSATSRVRIFNNGNVGINTTTDAGYKLDVNGTARVSGNTVIDGSLLAGTTASDTTLRYRFSTSVNFTVSGSSGGVYLGLGTGTSGYTGNNFSLARAYINEYGATVNAFMSTDSNPYTFRFGAYGSSSESLRLTNTQVTAYQKFVTSGSITAASALAQGVYFNNTLVAAANNDVLVGLDINPTFTNGAFTGVSNIGLRVKGDDVNGGSGYSLYAYGGQAFIKGNFNITGGYNLIVQNRAGLNSLRVRGDGLTNLEKLEVSDGSNKGFTVSYSGVGGYQFGLAVTDAGVAFSNPAAANRPVSFSMNTGEILRIHQSYTAIVTNNFLIGTTTDAGYKLDVNGNTSVRGILYVTDTIGTPRAALQGYDNNEIQLSASRWVNGSTATLDSNGLNINTSTYAVITGILGVSTSNTNTSMQPGRYGFTGRLIGSSSILSGGSTWAIKASAEVNITDGTTSPGTVFGVLIDPILGTLNNVTYVALRSTVGNVQLNTTSGNTLIGTTTDSGYKLDVIGDINTTTGYRVGGVAGWTGTITIITNPPGQQNIQVSGGIITNVT